MTQIQVHWEKDTKVYGSPCRTLGCLIRQERPAATPAPDVGSDLSDIVEVLGSKVTAFEPGDPVFGVTNSRFTGALPNMR